MRLPRIGKKGSTFGGWTEGIVLTSIFMLLFGVVIANMNLDYGNDIAVGVIDDMGIDSFVNETRDYQSSSESTLSSAEVEKGNEGGLSFLETWTLVNSLRRMVWNFVTGGWLETVIIDYLTLAPEIFYLFRALWIIAMVLLVVRLFMKVRA